MSLLCKFGFHRWEKWITVFIEYDKINYKIDKQIRHCERCAKIKIKYMIDDVIVSKEYAEKNYSSMNEPVTEKVDHIYGSTYNILKFEPKKDK